MGVPVSDQTDEQRRYWFASKGGGNWGRKRTGRSSVMGEAISMSSPSGRVSQRSRRVAERRLSDMIGPISGPKPPTQPTESERLRQQAKELSGLAARGMKPKAYVKKAAELSARADQLEHVAKPMKMTALEDRMTVAQIKATYRATYAAHQRNISSGSHAATGATALQLKRLSALLKATEEERRSLRR